MPQLSFRSGQWLKPRQSVILSRKVLLALNLDLCEVGAAASYLAVRREELGGTKNYQLESEKEANKMGVFGGGR